MSTGFSLRILDLAAVLTEGMFEVTGSPNFPLKDMGDVKIFLFLSMFLVYFRTKGVYKVP